MADNEPSNLGPTVSILRPLKSLICHPSTWESLSGPMRYVRYTPDKIAESISWPA